MANLTVVSGVGDKLPAAFLVELHGFRLLFDLGEGPQAGIRPDISGLGKVDAICLSHSHEDHTGALDYRAQLGNPPVFATAQTWQQLTDSGIDAGDRHLLPLKGHVSVGPVALLCGRSGHAPGSVWFHLPDNGGLTYMGDWSRESRLLPFDLPPAANLLITDGSYGDRAEPLAQQISRIAEAARGGAVLPVPAHGRGPEMALQLLVQGIKVLLCPEVRKEVAQLLHEPTAICSRLQLRLLELLHHQPEQPDYTQGQVIIATDAIADGGLAAQLSQRPGFRFIFSSHVASGTRARQMLDAEQAIWLPWNVHPVLEDQLMLIRATRARQVVAAFVPEAQTRQLSSLSPARLNWQSSIEF
ncbi:Cft2 family RNA processing exonuclease [Erwinia toletana]|uniref:Cft2 family RNA processing exonuclease n=1 Tax=Winslowiella toletana TaxID=92490 RepID=A0ABS4P8Z2_9GAMM|nr:MBL fold metallo-hydrolase [Winslowiella toletana]MBP2168403.1 Cft2 family RNA processing exonuclease [Winslowiella toletana]